MDQVNLEVDEIKSNSKVLGRISIVFIILTICFAFAGTILSSAEIRGNAAFRFGSYIGAFIFSFLPGLVITLICMLFVKKRDKRLIIYTSVSMVISILFLFSSINTYNSYNLKAVSIPDFRLRVPINWMKININNSSILSMGEASAATGIIVTKTTNPTIKDAYDIYEAANVIKNSQIAEKGATNPTSTSKIKLKGYDASSYEITNYNNGTKTIYIYTFIKKDDTFYLVMIWDIKTDFALKKDVLYKVRDSINFR